jgi:predicted dehydrogenase
MLKIGLVGCGTVSGYGHLPSIAGSDEWSLAAIADTNPTRLEQARQVYNPPHAFSDYRQLLDVPGLDAVAVATHMDTHHQIVTAALARGLHVLCEKPMAADLAQCQEMVDAARKAGRLLVVNFNTRCGPIYREIKRLIDAGTVGKLRVVRFVLDWSAHQWKPAERMEHFMAGGGPIVDSAVHFFEGVRWFSGQEFADIQAHGLILPPYESPQHAIATCLLTDGAVALVEAGWTYCKRTKDLGSLVNIDVIGDDGAISYDGVFSTLRIYTLDSTEQRRFEDTGKHFELLYSLFAESIRTGELVDLASGYDGLKATEASFKALASALSRSSTCQPCSS